MTNKIQELYKIAGVSNLSLVLKEKWSGSTMRMEAELTDACNFTAEKQLELIKWLYRQHQFSIQYAFIKNEYGLIWSEDDFHECWNTDFSQVLADLICQLWQFLSYDQKEEIKRVLK